MQMVAYMYEEAMLHVQKDECHLYMQMVAYMYEEAMIHVQKDECHLFMQMVAYMYENPGGSSRQMAMIPAKLS